MINIGNSLASESKMMYYPTQEFETYRLLALLGNVTMNYHAELYLKNILDKEVYNELFLKTLDNSINLRYAEMIIL